MICLFYFYPLLGSTWVVVSVTIHPSRRFEPRWQKFAPSPRMTTLPRARSACWPTTCSICRVEFAHNAWPSCSLCLSTITCTRTGWLWVWWIPPLPATNICTSRCTMGKIWATSPVLMKTGVAWSIERHLLIWERPCLQSAKPSLKWRSMIKCIIKMLFVVSEFKEWINFIVSDQCCFLKKITRIKTSFMEMKTDFAVIFILCPLKDINIWQPAHWFLITLYLGLTYSVHSLLFDYGNKAFRLSASGGLFSLYILSLILMNSNYFLISYWDPCNSNQWEQMEHGQRCFYNRHIYNPVPHFLTWLWEIWEKRFNSGKKNFCLGMQWLLHLCCTTPQTRDFPKALHFCQQL